MGRIRDILENEKEMRPSDLQNEKSHFANHNERNALELITEFTEKRNILIGKLEGMTDIEIYKKAIHPRLKTSMTIMNLFLLVAEHDYHHLSRINELIKNFKFIPKYYLIT